MACDKDPRRTIRSREPVEPRSCGPSVAAMQKAEAAWRRELAAQTVADMMAAPPSLDDGGALRWFGRDTKA